MAKPTPSFTPALLEKLCDQLRMGLPKKAAAAYVGISPRTLQGWEQHAKHARAKHDEGGTLTRRERMYLNAGEQLELAHDYGAAWLMHQILDAAGGEKAHLKRWQAYMTILERTRPSEWRRRASAEYIDRDDKTKTRRLDVSQLDAAERAQLRELLQKASGDD